MGILTHLHSAHSQVLLEWRAKGTGIGTEGQSSAASHWYLNVCLPPRPLSALQPLAFWHWNFTHRGKNQKLLHAFSSKEKKIQEDAWREINWTGCSYNCIFNENFICSKCFSSPPSHCIIPAAPRRVLWAQPDHPGVRSHTRQKSWEAAQSVLQLLNSTCAESQILAMPVLHLNGPVCTTFDFRPVWPLLERFRFRISFAP